MMTNAVSQVRKSYERFTVVERRFVSGYSWLTAQKVKLLVLCCAALVIWAVIWATTDNIVVGPFSVPKDFEERGYTSEAISTAVVQLIRSNNSTVALRETAEPDEHAEIDSPDEESNMLDNVEGKHVVSSFDMPTAAGITVPFTSITLGRMAELIRTLMGRKTTTISGQIVFDDKERELPQDAQRGNPRVLIRYNIEYPELSPVVFGKRWWSRRTGSITDQVSAKDAEDAVEKLAYIAADGINQRKLLPETEVIDAVRYINRGNAYIGLNDYERASRMFEQANESFKAAGQLESAHAYLALGWIAERERDYERARNAYIKAACPKREGAPCPKLDDDIAWAKVYLINLDVKERRQKAADIILKYKEVIETLSAESVPQLDGVSVARVSALNNIGFLYLSTHDWDNAKRALDSAENLAEQIRDAARKCAYGNSVCESNSGMGGNEQLNSLRFVNQANSLIAISYYGLAELKRLNTHDLTDLKQAYWKAIEADPSHARSHHQLSLLYAREHKNREAEEQFQTAARLDPRYKTAYAGLSRSGKTELRTN